MSISDLSNTIIAKSDQLNADDLIGASKTITITNVKRYQENGNDAFSIHYDGDCGRPYKPSKGMRRVMLFAWGRDGSKWIGRSMTLYNEPTVKWAGKEAGGIRISHMSDLEKHPINLKIAVARNIKHEFKIELLQAKQKAYWDNDRLTKQLVNATKAIIAGSTTNEQVITKLEQAGLLTDEQKAQIREIGKQPEPSVSEPPTISDDDFE